MIPDFINHLRKNFEKELPGQAAQLKMANAFRQTQAKDITQVRLASVLLLLYKKEQDWYFPLIQRTSNNKNDRHSGQISFPGGKYEDSDDTLEMTALREAEEEVGVIAKDIELIGALSQLYIPVSNFMVHPFVGYLPYVPQFQKQVSEVVEVVEVKLNDLVNKDNHKRKDIELPQGFKLKDVPYFDIQEKTVWGATAMMLSEWLVLLEQKM